MKPVIILSTYPDKRSITRVANRLVRKKLVACVNIAKIFSTYQWNGKIENTAEYLALFKTSYKNRIILQKEIKETHPYKVPEIAEIKVNEINKSYLDWITKSTI